MEGGIGSWIAVLDFDGVVTRLDLDWKKIREEVSKAVGREISSLNEYFRESYGTEDFMIAHSIVEKYELEAVEIAKPFEDALMLLNSFPQPIIISTMQSEKAVWKFLFLNNLERTVSAVLGRPRFGSKSDELKWIRENGAFREMRVLFIDDSVQNVKDCLNYDFFCIWIKKHLNSEKIDPKLVE